VDIYISQNRDLAKPEQSGRSRRDLKPNVIRSLSKAETRVNAEFKLFERKQRVLAPLCVEKC
jgi:hypothetical protein